MKKIFLIFMSVTLCVILFNTNNAIAFKENKESINYVESYYFETTTSYQGPSIFMERGDGYRGYLGYIGEAISTGGGPSNIPLLSLYAGRLYHPSVKFLRTPAKINDPNNEILKINDSNNEILNDRKYVTKYINFYCKAEDWPKLKCLPPEKIFYDDGVYKGYLEHDDSKPERINKDYAKIAYSGYVYRGTYLEYNSSYLY